MTYITWKERQTNASLFEKTLSLSSEKYHCAKKSSFSPFVCIFDELSRSLPLISSF